MNDETTKVTGNAARLREALEPMPSLLEWLVVNAMPLGIEDMVPKRRERLKLAKDALAAPPRNCDVGTAREQADRYREVELKRIAHLTRCPHAGFSAFFPKALDWANMPYEAAQKGGAV